MYRKKAKLSSNLSLTKDLDEENIIATRKPLISSLVGDQATLSPTTSTNSHDQEQVMNTNKYTTEETEKSVFDIFKKFKMRNDTLKINTYNQFSK